MTRTLVLTLLVTLSTSLAEARVVRLRIERREVVLNGRAFGAAGPYEKLVGKVDFGLDPALPRNGEIVDLKLAPRNARGEVESSADFYMLKPVDPRRGNGRLFYEVGNRGGKAMLATFQKAAGSADPSTDREFGDGNDGRRFGTVALHENATLDEIGTAAPRQVPSKRGRSVARRGRFGV